MIGCCDLQVSLYTLGIYDGAHADYSQAAFVLLVVPFIQMPAITECALPYHDNPPSYPIQSIDSRAYASSVGLTKSSDSSRRASRLMQAITTNLQRPEPLHWVERKLTFGMCIEVSNPWRPKLFQSWLGTVLCYTLGSYAIWSEIIERGDLFRFGVPRI